MVGAACWPQTRASEIFSDLPLSKPSLPRRLLLPLPSWAPFHFSSGLSLVLGSPAPGQEEGTSSESGLSEQKLLHAKPPGLGERLALSTPKLQG